MNIQQALEQIEANQTLNRSDVQMLVSAIKFEEQDLEMLETYLNEITFITPEQKKAITGDMYSYEF